MGGRWGEGRARSGLVHSTPARQPPAPPRARLLLGRRVGRHPHVHQPVQPARAQQGGVQQVGAVGRAHDEHVLRPAPARLRAVDLGEQRGHHPVHDAGRIAGTPAGGGQGVQFVEEEDSGAGGARARKHGAHAPLRLADVRIHQLGALDADKGQSALGGHRLGQQRLAGASRTPGREGVEGWTGVGGPGRAPPGLASHPHPHPKTRTPSDLAAHTEARPSAGAGRPQRGPGGAGGGRPSPGWRPSPRPGRRRRPSGRRGWTARQPRPRPARAPPRAQSPGQPP